MNKNLIIELEKQESNLKQRILPSQHNYLDFKGKRIITFGTFDKFHYGHKNIINKAIELTGLEENVIIGVSSDRWNSRKGKICSENEDVRLNNLKKFYPKATIILEDHNEPEESWGEIWDEYKVDLIVQGGDHFKNLEYINKRISPKGSKMKIMFFERTSRISSTLIKNKNPEIVLTYGTFDLLHHGHINILKKAAKMGDLLIVGLSTDEFNNLKGKKSYDDYETRFNNLIKNEFVTLIIPEHSWEQKIDDIKKYSVKKFVMGTDWKDKFCYLKEFVEVHYIERTKNISSTILKKKISENDK
ncbi:MAG: hypothetical protein TYPL_4470 [Candidatus Tyloplasma litorale]|nr:MAG: hypothetical protein TYPL_4470 [Mycoplasmatales bacterium]